MIGNETYANVVATDIKFSDFNDLTGEFDRVPVGFRHIGSGGFRSCFLGPDGVVYKREWGWSYEMNQNEAFLWEEQGMHADEMPEGVRLAECTLYGTVLAMEYIKDDGSTPRNWESLLVFVRTNVLGDCAHVSKRRQNWHSVEGVIVLTDYSL
jgi:hypothetical protein